MNRAVQKPLYIQFSFPADFSGRFGGQVFYFDVLELGPLFNLSFDPNIKIKDLTLMTTLRHAVVSPVLLFRLFYRITIRGQRWVLAIRWSDFVRHQC